MRAWKTLLVLFLVFILGAATGALVTRIRQVHAQHNFWQRPSAMTELIERKLTKKLNLNPEQTAQVHDILKEAEKKTHAVYATIQPEIKPIRAEAERQIEALLQPEQLEEFQSLLNHENQQKEELRQRTPLTNFFPQDTNPPAQVAPLPLPTPVTNNVPKVN